MKPSSKKWLWLTPLTVSIALGAALVPNLAHAKQERTTIRRLAFAPIGFVRGQTIRVSVARLGDVPPDPCRILLLDRNGEVVGDSGEFLLPAVQFGVRDFRRDDIDLSGEGDSGRLQVRAVINIRNRGGLPPDPIRSSTEVLDSETGKTMFAENQSEAIVVR